MNASLPTKKNIQKTHILHDIFISLETFDSLHFRGSLFCGEKSPKPGPSALWPPSCGRPYPLKVSPSANTMGRSHGWVGWKRDPGNPRLPIGFLGKNFQGAKMLNFKGGKQYSMIHWILRVFLVLTELQICGAVFLVGTFVSRKKCGG